MPKRSPDNIKPDDHLMAQPERVWRVENVRAQVAAERVWERESKEPKLPMLTIVRAVLASIDRKTTSDELIELVCAMCLTTRERISDGRRDRRTSMARDVAAYAMRTVIKMSSPETARALGQTVHSSVLYAQKKIGRMLGAA